MDSVVHPQFPVVLLRAGGQLAALFSLAVVLWAQGGAPPPTPPGPGIVPRLGEIRRKLDSAKPVDINAQRALEYGRGFLASAERASHLGQRFTADRMAEAADALLHVAEHQQHLRSGGGPKGPPPAEEIQDHLQRVYFRTQQADYFFYQAKDSRVASFPKWARDFYQLAVRAYERKDWIGADENAKCAEEVVRALESLAQAAAPANIPPSPPPKPPLPRGSA